MAHLDGPVCRIYRTRRDAKILVEYVGMATATSQRLCVFTAERTDLVEALARSLVQVDDAGRLRFFLACRSGALATQAGALPSGANPRRPLKYAESSFQWRAFQDGHTTVFTTPILRRSPSGPRGLGRSSRVQDAGRVMWSKGYKLQTPRFASSTTP